MTTAATRFTIAGATIIDGTGADGFVGVVTVEGDRIISVSPAGSGDGRATASAETGEIVDGTGLVLAPGFIDVHTHDDAALLSQPEHGCKTLQGVTSVVVGNCGFSAAPGEGSLAGFPAFATMADYLDALDGAGPAVNVAALVGHGSIRAGVMGETNSADPTEAELATMLGLLADALDGGAIGFSSGLEYEPGRYSKPAELHAFGRVAAERGAIYTTHMRNEGEGLIDSVDESIAVAELEGVSLQISHLKAAGKPSWGSVTQALEHIDAARGRGVDVMADQYPYTRGSTMLAALVTGGALDDGASFAAVTPAQVLIAAAPRNPGYEGKTLAELAEALDADPRKLADDIVEAEGRACYVVIDVMNEEDVCTVMSHPAVLIGTDGIPAGKKPHPRLGHSYPRILGRYVREQALISLPEAVERMTSLPAERFGFADRGVIREGAFADLVLFDPDTVLDTGTWLDPTPPPAGIVAVWCNGVRTVTGQAATGERPGRTVRSRV